MNQNHSPMNLIRSIHRSAYILNVSSSTDDPNSTAVKYAAMASFNSSLLFCSSDNASNALPLPYQAFDEFGLISIRNSNDLRADVGFWELFVSKKRSYKTYKQTQRLDL